VTQTTIAEQRQGAQRGAVYPMLDSYRTWIDTLADYMKRAAALLDKLYCEQDLIMDQLRTLCAKSRSLRRSDFDVIFQNVLANRGATRESILSLVDTFSRGRHGVIEEIRTMFSADVDQAVIAWPALKNRLLGGDDGETRQVVAALRQVHVEQEKISAALSGLLMRGDKLKIDDLRTVAQRLAGDNSRDSAELATLLAVCESAGRNVGLQWQRLAG